MIYEKFIHQTTTTRTTEQHIKTNEHLSKQGQDR